MLTVIAFKEIREIIGLTKFAITFGVCALLIVSSFYSGAKNYQVAQAQYRAAQAENLRQLDGLTDWFEVRDTRVLLPPQPLAALVTGVVNDIGRTIKVTGRGELTTQGSKFAEDPIFAVFQFLDLNFIFGIVLSLFAILLGFDAVCGEKENGTLRLALANAVPRGTYILGKLLGFFIALAVPLLTAIALGCLVLLLLGIPMNGTDWLRLGLIILAGLMYFGVFLTLAVFISAVTQRSSSSFLFLLVCWIFAVLIVPRAAVLLAGRAVEVPSVDEIAAQKASFSRQAWAEEREKLGQFKPSGAEDPEVLVGEFNRYMNDLADEREKEMQQFAKRVNEDRRNRQLQRQKLAFTLARLSPATQLSLALSTLAGTSIGLKDHYLAEATAYQESFGSFMKEKTGFNPGGRMMMFKTMSDEDEQPEPIDPREMPAFVYHPPALAGALSTAVVDLGLLTGLNLIFFLGAFVAFLRYDVR